LACRQVRIGRKQEESILDLWWELVLEHDQIASLKAENSSSYECKCSSGCWTEVKAKSQHRNKSHCVMKDSNFSMKVSAKFEVLIMSGHSGVAQLKRKENLKPVVNKRNRKRILLLVTVEDYMNIIIKSLKMNIW
jgi:hypothetical protein